MIRRSLYDDYARSALHGCTYAPEAVRQSLNRTARTKRCDAKYRYQTKNLMGERLLSSLMNGRHDRDTNTVDKRARERRHRIVNEVSNPITGSTSRRSHLHTANGSLSTCCLYVALPRPVRNAFRPGPVSFQESSSRAGPCEPRFWLTGHCTLYG
jgi:hypothetical protein